MNGQRRRAIAAWAIIAVVLAAFWLTVAGIFQ